MGSSSGRKEGTIVGRTYINFKNTFQYTLGADKYYLIPLIRGIWNSQIHSARRASLMAQKVENLPAMLETWVRSLGLEDGLEKRMATHSSILAWRIP